jgi:hypothetical protein
MSIFSGYKEIISFWAVGAVKRPEYIAGGFAITCISISVKTDKPEGTHRNSTNGHIFNENSSLHIGVFSD